MSDARDLLQRYLRQRSEMREPPIVFDAPQQAGHPPAGPDETDAPAEAPTMKKGSRAAKRPAAPPTPAADADAKWMRDAPPIPPAGVVVAAPTDDLFAENPLATLDIAGVAERVHACTACALHKDRRHAVPGEGPLDAKLVVVGEGPGAQEDETGRPFVGRAGQLLNDILAAIGFAREDVFICNVVKCRPPDNRTPVPAEIEACIPYLHRQLAVLDPAVILAMGATAGTALLGVRGSLGSMRNKVHEFRGTPLVVTYHPAALLRNPHWKKSTWDDVRIARRLVDRRA